MIEPRTWDERYKTSDLPWDTGRPDMHLQALMPHLALDSALDIGCGTGTNAVWLAQLGHRVVGVDLSPVAIERSQERAEAAGVPVVFQSLDVLEDPIPGAPFDLVFDRGCFHVFEGEQRTAFAQKVASLLAPDGVWISLLGSTDGPERDTGPPRRSAAEVMAAVEPFFEVQELRSVPFDEGLHAQKRAWLLLASPRRSR